MSSAELPTLAYEIERRELRDASTALAPKMYDAAVDLNLLAHRQRDDASTQLKPEESGLALAAYARGIGTLQAALLLFEFGSPNEANILVRASLECVFALAAIGKGHSLEDDFAKAHESARKSWAMAQQNVNPVIRFDAEILDKIAKASASAENFRLNYQRLAELGGLQDVYACLYKPLSHFSAHASEGSLGGTLAGDAAREMQGTVNLIVQAFGMLIIAMSGVLQDAATETECKAILGKAVTQEDAPHGITT